MTGVQTCALPISVVVENEALDGKAAFIVLVDNEGSLVAQLDTVIGGD